MLGEIDFSKEKLKPELFLCKPDMTIIAKLIYSFNIQQNLKLGQINELSFDTPYEVDIHHKLQRNPHIDLLRNRYLIKFVLGNYKEYYMIDTPTQNMNEDSDVKHIECFSLGYELADKIVRDYEVISKTATEILTDMLGETIWGIDYIDASYDLLYRSFSVSSKTVLDCVFEVAETFGAMIIFNIENRTISFYDPDNIGINRGLYFKQGKYLKSLEEKLDVSDFCTRLKIYGKDNTTIRSANTTGQVYIEDFSNFIYPFERDELGNVLKHSYYLSDGLCHAILDYSELLATKDGEFEILLTNKEGYQTIKTTKENELNTLNVEMTTITDKIYLAQSNNNSYDDTYSYVVGDFVIYNNTPYECVADSTGNLPTDTNFWSNLITEKDNKQIEIDNKQAEINTVQADIDNVDSQITTLRSELAEENNFTAQQIIEKNKFTITKEISNDYIDEPDKLLSWGQSEFEKLKQPQINIKIDIVNFLEIIECQHQWHKLVLGDIVNIYFPRFNINVQVKILEIDYNFENNSINLTISNIERINSDKDKFIKQLNNAISTSTNVNMNKYKWNNIDAVEKEVDSILNNAWQSAEREIKAGVNETVTIDRRGITITDSQDPLKLIRMTNSTIGLSSDGGNTYNLALNSSGIYAERLISQIIASKKLTITNDAGNFYVDKDGVTLENMNLTVTKTDGNSRILLNPTDGIKIQKKQGVDWTTTPPLDQFYADANGNLIVKGNIEIGSGSNIFKADTNGIYLGSGNFTEAPFRCDLSGNLVAKSADIKGDVDCTSLKINGVSALTDGDKISTAHIESLVVGSNVTMGSNAYISWNNVTDQPDIPTVPSYIKSTYISSTSILSPTITSATINGIYLNIGKNDINNEYIKVYNELNYVTLSIESLANIDGENRSGAIQLFNSNGTLNGLLYAYSWMYNPLVIKGENGVIISSGNYGIGINSSPFSGYELNVGGHINFTGNLYQNGVEFNSNVTYENLNANGDVGGGSTQVARGDHTHSDYLPISGGIIFGDLYINSGNRLYCTLIDFYTLTSAPSSPTAGTVYFNDTIDKLQVYNGSAWETIQSS